jgi:D-serine deaminase-like pyridoxal phosphate-dependent protein
MPTLDQARDHVHHQYGDDIGKRREELITPALVLDVDAAQRNIDHMAAELKQLGKATIRPHYKTHKSPDLARRQLQAGAGGLSMATVWEAAVLAGAGMDDLFVVNTVSHPAKLRMLAELARDHRILVAVDEAANAAAHSAAAVAAGSTLGIMIEVDTGMDRCGVDTAPDCLALARQVTDLPGLRFEGITGYEGHCSLTPDSDLRHSGQREAMTFFTGVADLLESEGIGCKIRSAVGIATGELRTRTGWHRESADEDLPVPPGQPQDGGAGRLHRLGGHDAVDGVRGEFPRRQHAALGVAARVQAEQLVEHPAVDHRHGQQVGGVGQRVNAEAQAPHPDLAPVQRGGHVPGERPGGVVHRPRSVLFRGPAELLVELAEHAPPQREVLAFVPAILAGGLEYADRDHLVHPARVADLGRIPPVQQERGPPGGRLEPERQRGDGQVDRAAAQIARVGDPGAQAGWPVIVPGAQAGRPMIVPGAEPGGGVLVRGRLAGVHAVEVAAAGER